MRQGGTLGERRKAARKDREIARRRESSREFDSALDNFGLLARLRDMDDNLFDVQTPLQAGLPSFRSWRGYWRR